MNRNLASQDIIAQCPGLTYRKLDYWCRGGCFGPELVTGAGGPRRFSEVDLQAAQIINQVSLAFQTERGGHADLVTLYAAIGSLVRSAGSVAIGTALQVALSPDVSLQVLVRDPQPA